MAAARATPRRTSTASRAARAAVAVAGPRPLPAAPARPGQGSNGGAGHFDTSVNNNRAGGGGGGAGSVGGAASAATGGDGGDGRLINFNGTPTYYGPGGGGGTASHPAGDGLVPAAVGGGSGGVAAPPAVGAGSGGVRNGARSRPIDALLGGDRHDRDYRIPHPELPTAALAFLISSRRTTPMTASQHGGSAARLSDADLELMLARAAEEGARRALTDVGLGGKDAVLTIHDMRSLLECIQFVRRTAVQTAVHVITTGVLIALLVGVATKLRWFGPNPRSAITPRTLSRGSRRPLGALCTAAEVRRPCAAPAMIWR